MEALLKSVESNQSEIARNLAINRDAHVRLGHMQCNCPVHGTYMSDGFGFPRRTGPVNQKICWSPCPTCIEEAGQLRLRQRDAAAAREREYQIADRIAAAGVPQRFVGKTLASFTAESDGQRRVMTIAQDYVDRFARHRERGDSLVFAGLPGTGKSLLAMLILQELCRRGYGARYTTCQALIQAIRRTWGKDGEGREAAVIDGFAETSLLVIDEIGVQAGTDNEKALLFDILDRRYGEMRPTIFGTNLDKANFQEFVGERVWDRLTEIARWVPFEWSSYRTRARREMATA